MIRMSLIGKAATFLRASPQSRTLFAGISVKRHFGSKPQLQENEKLVPNPWPDIVLPNKTVLDFTQEHLAEFANEPIGMCAVTGTTTTHGQVHEIGRKLAGSLHSMGLKQNDVLAVVLPNCIEYYSIVLAAAQLGAILNLINPIYTGDEIAYQLQDSNAMFVFTSNQCREAVKLATSKCRSVEKVILIDKSEDGCISMKDLLDDGHNFIPKVSVTPDDVFALLYSSGTTGLPKGVMLTSNNLCTNVVQYCHPKITDIGQREHKFTAVLPFYHGYAFSLNILANLKSGNQSIILDKFEPELYVNTLRSHRPTFLTVVPPMLGFFVNSPLVKPDDLKSVQTMIIGAAPVTKVLLEKLQAKIHPHRINILEGYGLTETGPVLTVTPISNQQIYKGGQLVPNTKARLVSLLNGCSLGPNQEGEIQVKGPQVMNGYFNNPKASEATFTKDGWFKTGDIGYYSEDGFIKIVDRAKELIKVKGLQVAPAELEALLLRHPSILDAAVIGVPDERAGEIPRAYVVLKSNMNLGEKDVQDFVAGNVAKHKQLNGGVRFLDVIPKSASGKILRRVIRKEFTKTGL